jgi:hypothetical protein
MRPETLSRLAEQHDLAAPDPERLKPCGTVLPFLGVVAAHIELALVLRLE